MSHFIYATHGQNLHAQRASCIFIFLEVTVSGLDISLCMFMLPMMSRSTGAIYANLGSLAILPILQCLSMMVYILYCV